MTENRMTDDVIKMNDEISDEIPAEKSVEEAAEEEEEMLFKKNDIDSKEAEIKSLKEEIEKLEANVADLKNAYAKAYADAENTKKRLNNDFEIRNKYKIQDFAIEILPVIDNCERALAIEVKDETDESYRKGFEMIYKQLLGALAKEGVTEIEALNKPFDANWHQALMMEAVEGVEPGIVTAVLQKGYVLKDRLLRAALVKVSE